jgi:hypothetical protein
MSFPRHRRSIHPMWKQTGSRLDAHSRLSSARMSRGRLFLGGSVSTGARFRFIGCGQNAVQWSCRSSNLQRTANSVLFACLSRGVHPTPELKPRLFCMFFGAAEATPFRRSDLERFSNSRGVSNRKQRGFFLRKKPLCSIDSHYTNWRIAIVGSTFRVAIRIFYESAARMSFNVTMSVIGSWGLGSKPSAT